MNKNVSGAWALIVATVTAGACTAALAQTPTVEGDFTDDLNAFDATRWMKADGWVNGSPFYNAWLADHISHANGTMSIRLDDVAALGMPYSSGNLQSNGFYGYGCYEARFKPVAQSGVVSSFFTFAGPYDNGGNGQHNEIDIEFLGYDTTRFQVNYWTNDDSYAGGNEHRVDAGFDASLDFHDYGFKWTSTGIEWFVDGISVYKADDTLLHPTPKAADSLHKVMMNVWPVDSTAEGWAGAFNYPAAPLYGEYDWIEYTAGENCVIGSSATDMHVQSIAVSANVETCDSILK